MFTDKITLAIAEAAKKCMDEELKGNQHKIDANKNGKVDAQDFKLLRKQKGVSEELKGNQHKIDANKNGKIDAQDFKLLRKEETVNEEHGYVAFSHDGRKADISANSSYEAHRKAIKHFDAPKAKHHMVHVHLAKKDGKDVVHTATESVQEAAIDDLRDRQAAKREANPYGSTDKKQDPTKRTVQGSQYGGTKQKDEKEVDESVQIDELSKDTMNSYVKKATADKDDSIKRYNADDRDAQGNKIRDRDRSPARKAIDNLLDKRSNKRIAGLKMANAKLAKEEVEQIDELSKATLGSYVKKASNSVDDLEYDREHYKGADRKKEASQTLNKIQKRETNIERAKGKLGRKYDSDLHGASAKVKATEELEYTQEQILDESKAHIEQHLADRDINSKVTGKVVKVHSSDITSAKKHVKMAGYKDHKVVGGLNEEKMTDEDMAQREKIVKGMKKNLQGFKARYGDKAKQVMYATATKQAMKEEEQLDEISLKKASDAYVKSAGRAGYVSANSVDDDEIEKHHNQTQRLHKAIQKKFGSASDKQIGDRAKNAADKGFRSMSGNSGYHHSYEKDEEAVKEEVTNDGFKAELEDNKAKAAGTKKQPDVSKAAVQSVKQESFSEKLSVLKEGVRSFLKGRNNG